MKFLTLIRHGNSPNDDKLSDFERILSEKGKIEAQKTGEYLLNNILKPDIIISSPAKRASETAQIIAEKINYPLEKIKYIDELYLCTSSDYIEILMEENDKIKHIFVVSHNPGTSDLAYILTNENIEDLPTCGVVHIEFDFYKWSDIDQGTGKLLKFITPNTIK